MAFEIGSDRDRHAGGEPPVEACQQAGAQIPGNDPCVPLRPDVGVYDQVGAEPDEECGDEALPDAVEMAAFFPGGSADEPC